MLVLTRTVDGDDGLLIGDNIRVRVLAINGRHVKVGVEAPKEVRVLREELVRQQDGGDATE